MQMIGLKYKLPFPFSLSLAEPALARIRRHFRLRMEHVRLSPISSS